MQRAAGLEVSLWVVQQLADTSAGWPGSTIDVWPDWATEQFPWARGTNLVISSSSTRSPSGGCGARANASAAGWSSGCR